MTPQNDIREKINEMITELAKTSSVITMYGEKHKLTQEAIDTLYGILDEVLSSKPEITIGIIGDEIAFEKEPFYEASRTMKDFIDHLKEIDAKKISFARGLTKDELAEFIGLLALKPKDTGGTEGFRIMFDSSNIRNIAIGEIGFRKAAKIKPEEVPDTKEKYEEGLEFIAQTFRKTKGQQALNLKSARQIVSSMIENLLKNKNLLLILTSIKSHDKNVFTHGVNTAVFTLLQAEALGLEEKYLNDIGVASLLHDTGKLTLPPEIMEKKDEELTEEDRKKIQELDVQGAKILLETPDVTTLAAIVAFEHNIPYDQSGEVRKVYGKDLNIVSMMISISEYYDKLKRLPEYQGEGGPERIYEEMNKLSGKKFHPDLLKNFFGLVGVYPPGTLVELDTGETALVVQASSLDIRRPQVEILYSKSGEKYKEPRIVNLLEKDKKSKFKRSIIKSVAPFDKELPEKYK